MSALGTEISFLVQRNSLYRVSFVTLVATLCGARTALRT